MTTPHVDEAAGLQAHHTPALRPMFMLRWEPAQQAHVLLYPEGVVKLNPTAADILQRCNGARTADDIIAELRSVYPEGGAQMEAGTRKFLDLAYAKGWIDI